MNDGIDLVAYIDGPATVTLPTAEYMVQRILKLGPGGWLYKTDLSREYRQLQVNPLDWPFLGFQYQGRHFMDICPSFGLQSSAMCMQRTAEAICFMHGKAGFASRPHLDDFGGAEGSRDRARVALGVLQGIMAALGVKEPQHKVHPPGQQIIWLGIFYDSVVMSMSIPIAKMAEIMVVLQGWEGRTTASRRDVQAAAVCGECVATSTDLYQSHATVHAGHARARKGWPFAGLLAGSKVFLGSTATIQRCAYYGQAELALSGQHRTGHA